MPTLYEKDFARWAEKTASLLRAGKFERVDMEQVAEEIADLGRSEKHTLDSQMRRLLVHLLKWRYQPSKRSQSWRNSIVNARVEIEKVLSENPSLKSTLAATMKDEYRRAIRVAGVETRLKSLPQECPFSVKQLLDDDYLPE